MCDNKLLIKGFKTLKQILIKRHLILPQFASHVHSLEMIMQSSINENKEFLGEFMQFL